MNLAFDFFLGWRWLLCVVVAVYWVLTTGRWALGWLSWLGEAERGRGTLSRYITLHALRVRWAKFGPDLAVCAVLTIVLLALGWLHWVVA